MKTRREASSLGCSAFSASRAAATSGRSCSHAWRTFFERDLVAVVEAPHRAHGDAELLLSTKSFADFLQRQIGLLGNEMEQQSSCALSGDRLWPVQGLSSTLPVVVHRLSQRTAVEAATLSRRATSRRLSPSSTNATARARKSFEYPLAMVFLRRC